MLKRIEKEISENKDIIKELLETELKKPTETDPYYYVIFGEDSFIHLINDWEQLRGRWNWYTFHFIHIYLEKDIMCGGYEFEFVILGLGFRLRINDTNSKGYKEIIRRLDDAKDLL